MAGEISGASLQPIYQRMNAAPQYHPLEADTFADWTVEAGDVVTISRGSTDYQSPVHSSVMVWRGSPQVTLSATGNEQRKAISKVSKEKYARGGSGISRAGQWYNYQVNQEHLLYEVFNTDGRMSHFEVTVGGLYHEVYDSNGSVSILMNTAQGLVHEVYDTDGRMSVLMNTTQGLFHEVYDTDGKMSVLMNTADGLYHEVYDPGTGLKAEIQTQAGRISLVVTDEANPKIKAAQIVTSINNTGSNILISADKIQVSGTTTINDVFQVADNRLNIKVDTRLNGNMMLGSLTLRDGNNDNTLSAAQFAQVIKSASVENNTLTLTQTDGTEITFSKATTLSGAWGSGDDAQKFIVTASPQGVNYKYAPPLRLNGTNQYSNFSAEITDSSNPPVAKKVVRGYLFLDVDGTSSIVDVNTESDRSGSTVARINVGSVYTAGSPSSGQAISRHGSGYDWDFTITRRDGTTKTLQIDCSDIYVAARDGYTLGIFTQATVTPQGSAQTVFVEATSGGSDYYKAGSAQTLYNAGSGTKYDRGDSVTAREIVSSGGTVYYLPGSQVTYYERGTPAGYYTGGSSFTVQGSKHADITAIGTAYWFKQHPKTETPTGAWYSYHTTDPGGTGTIYKRYAAGTTYSNLYNAGTTTKYERGTYVTVTPIGTEHTITPCSTTSTRLGSAGTYYKGNGGSFTPQGSSTTVTPIDANTKKHLLSTTRYKAGTPDSSTYYTKS